MLQLHFGPAQAEVVAGVRTFRLFVNILGCWKLAASDCTCFSRLRTGVFAWSMPTTRFEVRYSTNCCVRLVPIETVIEAISISSFVFIRKIDRLGWCNIVIVHGQFKMLHFVSLPFELQQVWTEIKHWVMLLLNVQV